MSIDQSIQAQNAGNIAAQLTGPIVDPITGDVTPNGLEVFSKIRKAVFDGTSELAGSAPGVQVPSQPLPAGAIAPPPSAGVAPAPVASGVVIQDGVDAKSADVLADYRANPGDYYDNRATKQKPSQPDFRHKTKKNAKGYNHGAWLPDA